jgi:type IV pilus assembly protein PilA
MQKLWKRHQKFMKGDAGFSLVELIIVIAIMAALIAILAPQYIKYVEKSRVAADETVAAELLQAAKVAASDPDVSISADCTVVWTGTTGVVTYTGGNTNFESAVTSSIGGSTTIATTKSATHKAAAADVYTVTVDYETTGIEVSGDWG